MSLHRGDTKCTTHVLLTANRKYQLAEDIADGLLIKSTLSHMQFAAVDNSNCVFGVCFASCLSRMMVYRGLFIESALTVLHRVDTTCLTMSYRRPTVNVQQISLSVFCAPSMFSNVEALFVSNEEFSGEFSSYLTFRLIKGDTKHTH